MNENNSPNEKFVTPEKVSQVVSTYILHKKTCGIKLNFDDDVEGEDPNVNPNEEHHNNMSSQDDSIIVDTIETENENLYSQECDDTTKTKRIKIEDNFFPRK